MYFLLGGMKVFKPLNSTKDGCGHTTLITLSCLQLKYIAQQSPGETVYTVSSQRRSGVDLHYVPLTVFLLGKVPAAGQQV